jgi:prolyl-tRNA synthetase
MFLMGRQKFSEEMVAPRDFRFSTTLELLDQGLVAYLQYPGVPMFSSLGTRIVERIESVLTKAIEASGFTPIRLPLVMRDSDLERGEAVGDGFARNKCRLSDRMEGYHMMLTPEMGFFTGGAKALSHRNLPIRHSYSVDLLRQTSRPESFFTTRQLRVLGAISIEPDIGSVREALETIGRASSDALTTLGLPLDIVWRSAEPYLEQSYEPVEERPFPRFDSDVGLSLGNEYGASVTLPLQYTDVVNRKNRVKAMTYGLSINRTLVALFDAHRDAQGFSLPRAVRPFDVGIVAASHDLLPDAERLANAFASQGVRSYVDDRHKLSKLAREKFAHYIGVPFTVLVDRDQTVVAARDGRRIPIGMRTSDSEDSAATAIVIALGAGIV